MSLCLECGVDLTGKAKFCLWRRDDGSSDPDTDFNYGDCLCDACAVRIFRLRGYWPCRRSDLLTSGRIEFVCTPNNSCDDEAGVDIAYKDSSIEKKHKPKKLLDPKKLL